MEDVHKVLFPQGPPSPKTDEELREGIRAHMRKKHARVETESAGASDPTEPKSD